MQFLNDLTRAFKSNVDKNLYNFPTIDYHEIEKYPDLLKDIHNRKMDGIVVENVFTPQEVELMKIGTAAIPKELRNAILGGEVFPKIFAQVVMQKFESEEDKENKLKKYFAESKNINQNYSSLVGVDFTNRLEGLFKKISGTREIKIPKGDYGIGEYANATVRRYFSGSGFISVHCGRFSW